MIGFFIALISGALMSIQGVFNTEVTKKCGEWVTNVWVQFSALIVCIVFWLFTGRQSFTTLLEVENKYMLSGGIIGAFITLTVIKSMSSLGPAKATMLIVVAQLLVSYLIEVFGLFGMDKQPFQWIKVVGMGLCAVGIVIFKWE